MSKNHAFQFLSEFLYGSRITVQTIYRVKTLLYIHLLNFTATHSFSNACNITYLYKIDSQYMYSVYILYTHTYYLLQMHF